MGFLIGRPTVASNADFASSGSTAAWDIAAARSGLLERIYAQTKTTNTGTLYRLGLYADNGAAAPGARLCVADVTLGAPRGSGVFGAVISPGVPIVAGTTYWLATFSQGDDMNFLGDSGGHYFETSPASNFPDPYGATTPASSFNMAIWGESWEPPTYRTLTLDDLMELARFKGVPIVLQPIPQPPPAAPGGGAVDLAADILGQAAVAADLARDRPFAADILGQAAITAPLDRLFQLAAAINGVGSVTSALDRALALEAAIAGVAAVTGDVSTAHEVALDAVIAGGATIVADLAVARQLAASVQGQAAIQAALAREVGLQAVVQGQAAITAPLISDVALNAIVNGQAQIVAGLTAQRLLAAVLNGQATIVAALNVTGGGGGGLVIVEHQDMQIYIAHLWQGH